jgi:MIP family channel proteins
MADAAETDIYDRDITIVSIVQNFHSENFAPSGLIHKWLAPFLAEMIGPFALVLFGAGSIMTAASQGFGGWETILVVALAHGLAIGLMIAGAGHISGGHYNPAVTVAMFVGGRIGMAKGLAYIGAQLIGAVLAALVLQYIFGDAITEATNFGIPSVNYATDGDAIIVGKEHAFVLEVILTFFLVYVIFGTAVDSRGAHAIAPLAIGLTITLDIFLGGPLTGAAMNPARWFGPAVVDGDFKDGWLYILGPITGALIASVLHNYIFIPRETGFAEAMPSEHHQ